MDHSALPPLYEVHYTSSEQGILSQSDGFGIRTYSEQLPEGVLERLQELNFFHYSAGNQALAGKMELQENPDLVLDYPPTYRLETLEVEEKSYRVFARSVFIGHDYQFYLDNAGGARSGNMYIHSFIWPAHAKANPRLPLQLLDQFVPQNPSNRPDNPEMLRLLTGAAELLPPSSWKANQPPTIPLRQEAEVNLLKKAWEGLVEGKCVYVHAEAAFVPAAFRLLLSYFPQLFLERFSLLTNSQHFLLPTDYSVVFLHPNNESHFKGAAGTVTIEIAGHTELQHADSPLLSTVLQAAQTANSEQIRVIDQNLSGYLKPGYDLAALDQFWSLLGFAGEKQILRKDKLIQLIQQFDWAHSHPKLKQMLVATVNKGIKRCLATQKYRELGEWLEPFGVMKKNNLVGEDRGLWEWGAELTRWIVNSSGPIPWKSLPINFWSEVLDWSYIHENRQDFFLNLPPNSELGTALFQTCFDQLQQPSTKVQLILFCVERSLLPASRGKTLLDQLPSKAIRKHLKDKKYHLLAYPKEHPEFWDEVLQLEFNQLWKDLKLGAFAKNFDAKTPLSSLEGSLLRWMATNAESPDQKVRFLLHWSTEIQHSEAIDSLLTSTLDEAIRDGLSPQKALSDWKGTSASEDLRTRIKFLTELSGFTAKKFLAALAILRKAVSENTLAHYFSYGLEVQVGLGRLDEDNLGEWFRIWKNTPAQNLHLPDHGELSVAQGLLAAAFTLAGSRALTWAEDWLDTYANALGMVGKTSGNRQQKSDLTVEGLEEDLEFLRRTFPQLFQALKKRAQKSPAYNQDFKDLFQSNFQKKTRGVLGSLKSLVNRFSAPPKDE